MIKEIYVLGMDNYGKFRKMEKIKVFKETERIIHFSSYTTLGKHFHKSRIGDVIHCNHGWIIVIKNLDEIENAQKKLIDVIIEYREARISILKKQILEQKDWLSDLYKLEQGR